MTEYDKALNECVTLMEELEIVISHKDTKQVMREIMSKQTEARTKLGLALCGRAMKCNTPS